jgi:NAD(P)-dependent dehydrogenase (short-subunit alcohol dehydrogenase family)
MATDSVLITGASSGIGKATVAALLKRNYRVFGTIRQESHASDLKNEFGSQFFPLLLDVRDGETVINAAKAVKETLDGSGLRALINNAGVTVQGPLMHFPLKEFQELFDINVFGPLRLIQAFLPLLGAQRPSKTAPGRIINVSSVAGKLSYPFLGAYAASKHALEAMSDALRRELMIYGIDVIVIEPSEVATPIFDKQPRVSSYATTDYGAVHQKLLNQMDAMKQQAMPVDRVVKHVLDALEKKRPKTRYAVLPYSLWLWGWFLPRHLTDRALDRLVARLLWRDIL